MKNWNDGMLEYWENQSFIHHPNIPLFQYSIIPFLFFFNLCTTELQTL